MRRAISTSTVFILLAGALPAPAQVAPAGRPEWPATIVAADTAHALEAAAAEPLPVDPRVRVGTLPNGLRYYIRVNGRPEGRAELRLAVDAGWILEDEDQWGLAHFVEHMAFNGTEHFEKQDLVDYLESIGMRFGPELNAYTDYDETVYMLTVPTDVPADLENAFLILRDWAGGIAFDSVEVEKERGVVLEELRGRRGAGARLRRQQFPVLFHGSRYAERIPDTPREIETVGAFAQRSLRRFYDDWYRPDLMAVIAVGDFDPDWVEEQIRERFAGLAGPAVPRERTVFEVPPHEGTLFSIATDPELTSSSVSVVYKQPLASETSHGDYRRGLVEATYNSMLNFRFYEIVQVSEDPPFVGAGSGNGRFVRRGEVYQLGAAVKEGEIERGLERILIEADRVDRYGFTGTELARQKEDLIRAYQRSFAEREKTESSTYASEYLRSFLEGEPIPGIAYEYALVRRYVPGITLDEVNHLGQAWIRDTDRVVLVSVPEKEGLAVPAEDDLLTAFARADSVDPGPWEDRSGDGPLLGDPPEGGRVVEEHEEPAVGVTAWRLDNGVRVLLKPTDFKDDQVLVNGWSPGGTSLAGDPDYVSASWAATLVSLGGVGEFSAVDLQKKLAGRVVSLGPSIGELEEGMSGSASPEDLETLFELMYLYFTAPRRDTTAFLSFRSRLGTVLENRSASPEAVYGDSLAVILSQGHPRRQPPTEEMIGQIDLDAGLGFYRERFAEAGDFTFTFVGSFSLAEMRPLVERYLGGLPSRGRVERWRDVGVEAPDGIVRRTVRKGLEPKGRTTLVFEGPFEFTRENRYVLQSLADVLEIMLRETLREDLGATYGVGVSTGPTRDPRPRYSVRLGFGADPERLDELTEVAFATIDSLAEHGASAENLAKVREAQRRQRETDLKDNGFWLSILTYYDRHGEDLSLIMDYDRLMEELTAEDIGAAAALYLSRGKYVQVSLVPEADPAPRAGLP